MSGTYVSTSGSFHSNTWRTYTDGHNCITISDERTPEIPAMKICKITRWDQHMRRLNNYWLNLLVPNKFEQATLHLSYIWGLEYDINKEKNVKTFLATFLFVNTKYNRSYSSELKIERGLSNSASYLMWWICNNIRCFFNFFFHGFLLSNMLQRTNGVS